MQRLVQVVGRILLIFCCHIIFGCAQQQEPKKNLNQAASLNVEMGKAYLETGQVSRAKKKLVHALELKPKLPEALTAMGYFYETVGDYSEAEKYYKQSIRYGNKSAFFYNNYASYLCRRGKFNQSEELFMQALQDKLYDKTAEIYANMGHCVLKAGQVNKAEQYLRFAIQHDPRDHEVLLEVAELCFARRNFVESKEFLEKFRVLAKPEPRSLWLGIRLAKYDGNYNSVSSQGLLLKNLFPQSAEYSSYVDMNLQVLGKNE